MTEPRPIYVKAFREGLFQVHATRPVSGDLHTVHQIHSARVAPVSLPDLANCQADGMTARWNGKTAALAIKTADCLPILVLGEHGMGLLHAGWRGLAQPILSAAEVRALSPNTIFVGPCIRACCFEVTPEFQAHFPSTPLIHSRDGKLRFDLVAEARRQAERLYPGASFEESGECTCCIGKYHSYRRDKTQLRNWNCFSPLAN